MKDLIKALSKLHEMNQFGYGLTFDDLLKAIRSDGSKLAELWPWVPFGTDGNVLCTSFPTPSAAGYEVLMVYTPNEARFPDDASMGFALDGIEQHIKAIRGAVTATTPSEAYEVTCESPVTLPPGTLTHLHYMPGLYLFRQTPRIAGADDFTFEKFR